MPEKLAAAMTDDNGSFSLTIADGRDAERVLYLIAEGGAAQTAARPAANPATVLMATWGPSRRKA